MSLKLAEAVWVREHLPHRKLVWTNCIRSVNGLLCYCWRFSQRWSGSFHLYTSFSCLLLRNNWLLGTAKALRRQIVLIELVAGWLFCQHDFSGSRKDIKFLTCQIFFYFSLFFLKVRKIWLFYNSNFQNLQKTWISNLHMKRMCGGRSCTFPHFTKIQKILFLHSHLLPVYNPTAEEWGHQCQPYMLTFQMPIFYSEIPTEHLTLSLNPGKPWQQVNLTKI